MNLCHSYFLGKCWGNKKAAQGGLNDMRKVGWLMGLEPTTTGITILDSTN